METLSTEPVWQQVFGLVQVYYELLLLICPRLVQVKLIAGESAGQERCMVVVDIQLSTCCVCSMAKCIVMHRNKPSTKTSHLGDNQGIWFLFQLLLGIHGLHSKDMIVSTSTCSYTGQDHQTASSVSVMFYNSLQSVSMPVNGHRC